MPKVFDEDGTEVKDVITKEEHEKQLADAAKKAIEEATKSGTVVSKEEVDKLKTGQATLEADLKKAKEAIDAADKKDTNFETLRKAKEKAEQDLKEFKDSFGTKLNEIEKKVDGGGVEQAIGQLSEGDAEMAKKIKFQYDRIAKAEDTADERKQKLIDAATLAKGSRPAPSLLNGVLSGASSYSKEDMKDITENGGIKPELAGLAKNLGITDKDVAKFGNK